MIFALKMMKSRRALELDGIPIEAWKCLGDVRVSWLTKLFNKIIVTKKMLGEWRKSILVPIFKLMCHTIELWERVIEQRLRYETTISENQFGLYQKVDNGSDLFIMETHEKI